jgi:arylsulfatase A-like enzyme
MSSLLKQRGQPNIVVLVIDCGRWDRFSTYGHYRPTTPNIDRLASQGLVFEQAYSVDTATPLSHFALMSGQQDWNGRAWLNGATIIEKTSFLIRRAMRRLGLTDYVAGFDEKRHSLIGLLREAGYFTLGVSANHLVSPKTMQAYSGFEKFPEEELNDGLFDDPQIAKRLKQYKVEDSKANRQAVYLTADRVLTKARNSLVQHNPNFERPFFLFANLMDCHDPYLVNEDVKDDFGFKPNSDFNGDLRNRELPKQKTNGEAYRWTDSEDLDPQTVDLLRWNYDRCLNYIDQQVGALWAFLEEQGQAEETVFIITADHGEQLGENGFFTHSQQATEFQTHIPMILSGSKYMLEGQRITNSASLVDIRPSILDLLGIDDPFEHRSGQSLFGKRENENPIGLNGPRNKEQALFGSERDEVSEAELAVLEERLRDLGYLD